MSTAIDYDDARRTLTEERSKLLRQMKELGADERGALRSDREFADSFADAGAATAERTEVLVLVEALKGQLDDIDAALAKLDGGTYGVCDDCGEPISPARLEARPEARFCVDCQSRRT